MNVNILTPTNKNASMTGQHTDPILFKLLDMKHIIKHFNTQLNTLEFFNNEIKDTVQVSFVGDKWLISQGSRGFHAKLLGYISVRDNTSYLRMMLIGHTLCSRAVVFNLKFELQNRTHLNN